MNKLSHGQRVIEPRKELSASGLLMLIREVFDQVPGPVQKRNISLTDALMSGIAMFGLKYPSLLAFDEESRDRESNLFLNLRSLYHIKQAPSDTHFRELLDDVDPSSYDGVRYAYKRVFEALQRGKVLETFRYFDDSYLMLMDGTGHFSSDTVHCENCCVKHHKDGSVSYYHQMLAGVLAHPDHKEVFPFAPEPILKQDGATKNDCERNASKRFLTHVKREHPHLKLTIVEDGLASNAPHIQWIQLLGYHFILGAKPDDHKHLFQTVNALTNKVMHHQFMDDQGITHTFRYLNNAPLNESSELSVNFFEYWEKTPKGQQQHFSWVTDIEISSHNLMKLMRAARTRWMIENETFNTLKNQGYKFEHNFGHGYQHLSTVLSQLMLLAFFIDQVQQHCCPLFKAALEIAKKKTRLWFILRSRFFDYVIASWEDLFYSIIYNTTHHIPLPTIDTG